MEIIGLIIAGIVVGLLGRLLHPGHDPMGLLATIGVGVVSVLVVGLVLSGLGFFGFVLAIIVAALLVALWSRVSARSGHLA